MALEIKQSLSMVQQLVITPQLQQAIRLLQLSRQDLLDEVQEQMVENPALEVDGDSGGPQDAGLPTSAATREEASFEDPPPQPGPTTERERTVDPIAELDWAKYVDSIRDQQPIRDAPVRSAEDYPSVEATLTRTGTLADHLVWQLRMQDCGDDLRQLVLVLINNLDSFGYLKGVTIDEVAEQHDADADQVAGALKVLQGFDPLGVGARDLSECLLIQARVQFPGDEAMLEVLEQHLESLGNKNYAQIARHLRIPVEEVYEIHRQVTELDPRPGRAYAGDEPRYITPDIYIVRVGDRFEAVLNEDGLPKLRVSQYYRRALADGGNRKTKEYIQDKLRSAAWLIRSIHQRQRTILKVTQSIIKFQREFLERGIDYLRPLILRDVADDIGMHESTISRVTSSKYVHTPQGIFELKFFFNAAIGRCRGEDIASEAVKNKIRQIVQGEPRKKPYSDQKIVQLLKEQNISIARRTVAKYREMLGILPSSKRKRMF